MHRTKVIALRDFARGKGIQPGAVFETRTVYGPEQMAMKMRKRRESRERGCFFLAGTAAGAAITAILALGILALGKC